MARQVKKTLIIGGAAVIAALSWGAIKVLYLGVEQRSLGHVGTYEVVACETWHSIGSMISNDARGGFYRIYDSEGKKVFEQFSDAFAFDVVITSDQYAEFQLCSGEINYWIRPD